MRITITEYSYVISCLLIFLSFGAMAYWVIKSYFNYINKPVSLATNDLKSAIEGNHIEKDYFIIGGVTAILYSLMTQHGYDISNFYFFLPVVLGLFFLLLFAWISEVPLMQENETVDAYRDRIYPSKKRVVILTVLFCLFCAEVVIASVGNSIFFTGKIYAENTVTGKYVTSHPDTYHLTVRRTSKKQQIVAADHEYGALNLFVLKQASIITLAPLFKDSQHQLPEKIVVTQTVYDMTEKGDTLSCSYVLDYVGNAHCNMVESGAMKE